MATITKPVLLDETGVTIKTAIEGISAAIVAGQLAPVTVSGTSVTLTAEAGKRYICGELTDLTLNVPASGMTDIIFQSGATPTVILISNNAKLPDGFVVEASKTYELNFLDGLGAVQSWTTSN